MDFQTLFDTRFAIVGSRMSGQSPYNMSRIAVASMLMDAALDTRAGSVIDYVIVTQKETGTVLPMDIWSRISVNIVNPPPEGLRNMVLEMPASLFTVEREETWNYPSHGAPIPSISRLMERMDTLRWCCEHDYGPPSQITIPLSIGERDFAHLRLMGYIGQNYMEIGHPS